MMKTPDSLFKGSYNMLNVDQLNHSSDSIRKILTDIKYKRIPKEVNSYFASAPIFMKGTDAFASAVYTKGKAKSYAALLPDSVKTMSYSKAADKINLVKNALDLIAYEDKQRQNDLLMYHIAWHKKFAFSFACIVLFLIGAPLGAIIRKGGLGMPLVVAVVFFLLFHLLNVFGEKFVRQELMSPFWGIWLSSLALLPVGIFLVFKAMNDSQLFNNEFYFRFFKSLKSNFTKKQQVVPIN
jgi:lipopolysaccharide export system permease protein